MTAMSTLWFQNLPIRRKLTLIMIGVMAVSFALSSIITGCNRYRSDRRELEHHLSVLAGAIGANCSAALVFEDETAAAEVLSALHFDRSITCAVLTDARSKRVASFGNCGVLAASGTFQPGSGPQPFDGHIRVDQRIVTDGDTVGYLTIWAETGAITGRMATEGVVGMTAFLLGVLVVMMLFERMLRLLTAPLVDLHETMRKIVRTRDYSMRATKRENDELGDLVVAFNQMVAQVEDRIPPAVSVAEAPADADTASAPVDSEPVSFSS